MQVVPHLCKFYPGICLATEEEAQKKTQSVWNIWCCYLENPKNFFCCRWTLNCWFRIYAYVCMYVCMYVFFPLSLLHYRGVIWHAGIHLCFSFIIADAVIISVIEFPLQLQLLQRLLRTLNTWSHSTQYLNQHWVSLQ